MALRAQTPWPSKPIRIIVGAPPGGQSDVLARVYGEYLGQRLGRPVIVENKPGAAGILAGAEAARAAPDGHTFWWTITGSTNQNRVLFKRLPYDPDRDFVHVSGFDPGPLPLGVPAASPIRNMRDLLEFGKTQRITFGNYSAGSFAHMMAQQLSKKYRLTVEPVTYKGEAPMWADLASGQLTIALGSAVGMSPHLQSGKVRAIAVTTRGRSTLLPDIPTFDEQGFTDPVFVIQGWQGLLAPANTPQSIVRQVSDIIQDAASTPRVRELNKTFGMAAKPWSAAEFEKLDREIRPILIELARELNITLD